MPVLRPVDVPRLGPEHGNSGRLARQGEIVGNLASECQEHAQRFLLSPDVEDPLEAQLLEIQGVSHVVVGRDRFGIAVHHHRRIAQPAQGLGGADAAPVELDRRSDPIRPRPENQDLAATRLGDHVIFLTVVGQVEVVRAHRPFSRQRIDLFHDRHDRGRLAPATDLFGPETGEQANLLVAEPRLLGAPKRALAEATSPARPSRGHPAVPPGAARPELLPKLHDTIHLCQEPAIDAGLPVELGHRPSPGQCLRQGEDPARRGARQILQRLPDVEVVADETAHIVAQHAAALLERLLERAADRHHLPHGLHLAADEMRRAPELLEVPFRHLHDQVVEGRLETGGRGVVHRVLEIGKAMPERQLRGDAGQRIAGRLAGEG